MSTFWQELYGGRPTCSQRSDLIPTGNDVGYLGWHLCMIDHPMIVVGYHFMGYQFYTDSEYRFWIQRADQRTGLPTGDPLPNSDTLRKVNPTSAVLTRDNAMRSAIGDSTHAVTDLEYVDLVLPNPVIILEPGLYWIGIAHRAQGSPGESLVGSFMEGYIKGLRDMMYDGFFETLEEIDPRVVCALDYTQPLIDQVFVYPDNDPSVVDLCNTEVYLITEKQ